MSRKGNRQHFRESWIGGQIGQIAGGVGGSFLPLNIDPITAAPYAQQQALQQSQLGQQFAPQGFIGNLLGQIGQPLGSAIGGLFGNAGLGGSIGSAAGQFGRLLPFGADPYAQALQQAQQQQAQQQALQQALQQQALQQAQQMLQQQHSAYPGYQTSQSIGAAGGYGGQPTVLH